MDASGLIVVDKPAGLTSHDVVARVRRMAGTRKVGHAGTLDPMATGVLLVGLNRATRLLGHLMLTDKAYDATIRLGATTHTDDAEGDVLATADTASVTEEAVHTGLAAMIGEIEQRPSSVSAIKVDGRRAYDRVRAGEEVELPSRRVRVDAIEVTRVDLPEVDISVRCSSGTYIRAIARDLGEALGVGGHLTMLRRTAVGPFTEADAHTLDDLADDFAMTPLDQVARRSFAAHDLDQAAAQLVRHGRALDVTLPAEGPVAVFSPAGDFLALYENNAGPGARAVAVFV